MFIQQLQTACLSQFAYYIESEGEAAIIDPLRETEPYLKLAQERGAEIKYVLETHFHADFVSGHIDLAKKSGAKLVYGEKAQAKYEVYHAKNDEVLPLGKLQIQVIPTPGHTIESVSYLLFDESGKEHAIFTGDALFVGDVGRPDLSSGNLSQEELASMLYDTLQNRFKTLPDNVIVYPAHGQGSSCGKNLGPETFSTIGEQKKSNYALQEKTKDEFIKEVTDGLGQPPSYFFEDARINQEGYENIDDVLKKNLKPLSSEELELAQLDGALVLDTRKADVFEQGHVPKSWNISLRGNYAPWVGALIPFGTRIVVITEQGEEEEAVLRLARVGYENVVGFLKGGFETWTSAEKPIARIESIEASSLPSLLNEVPSQVLDVRTVGEFKKGHAQEAINIPLNELPGRLSELSLDKVYAVHCAGGYRSMVASSILQAHDFSSIKNINGGYNVMKEVENLSIQQ